MIFLSDIEERAEYYGLGFSYDGQDKNKVTVRSPQEAKVAWIEFSVNEEEAGSVFAKFFQMDELEILSDGPTDENGDPIPLDDMEVINLLLPALLPTIALNDLPNRPDIEKLWLGTGKWFLLAEVHFLPDNSAILYSKKNSVIRVPHYLIPIRYKS